MIILATKQNSCKAQTQAPMSLHLPTDDTTHTKAMPDKSARL
jgi:hypothetical protein